MTYVVLVILIALWAMVLLPPYLKDRRSTSRTFRSLPSSGSSSAQRFLPLQQAATGYATSAVQKPTGMRAGSGVSAPVPSLGANVGGANFSGTNVVQLRPVGDEADAVRAPLATSAAAYLDETPVRSAAEEAALHEAWENAQNPGIGVPRSTSAARERRRHVLLGLTGLALATLMLAIFGGGRWIAAHVLVDVVMLGYVILLVRHRQLAAERMMKIEPIRPPVNEQPPVTLQAAPSYLLRSNTGS